MDVREDIDELINEVEEFLCVTVSDDKWLGLGAKVYSKCCRLRKLVKDVKEKCPSLKQSDQTIAFLAKTTSPSSARQMPPVVKTEDTEGISDDEEYMDIDEKKKEDAPPPPPRGSPHTKVQNVLGVPGEHTDKQNDDFENNTVQGWLEKKKPDKRLKLGSSFQKRWCVITGSTMSYYEKPGAKKVNGDFDLTGYEFSLQNDDTIKDEKKGLHFALLCPGERTYFFIAQNSKELEMWQNAVNNASGRISEQEISPPADDDGDDYVDPVSQKIDDTEELVYDDTTEAPSTTAIETEDGIITEDFYDECGVPPEDSKPPTPIKTQHPSTKQDTINYDNYYLGMWDSTAESNNELSFKRGDAIYILSKQSGSPSWWIGQIGEKTGIVPKEYLFKAYRECKDEH